MRRLQSACSHAVYEIVLAAPAQHDHAGNQHHVIDGTASHTEEHAGGKATFGGVRARAPLQDRIEDAHRMALRSKSAAASCIWEASPWPETLDCESASP